MTRSLAFYPADRQADYGSRLARLRWRRACGVDRVADWAPAAAAPEAVQGATVWIVVRDPAALPAIAGEGACEPPAGRVLVSGPAAPADPSFVHTLRELEGARLQGSEPPGSMGPAAIAFRAADFPARHDETIESLVGRLLMEPARALAPGFRAIAFGEPSERERPELTRRLPRGPVRILDAGCGAGAALASAKARHPGWRVTGIERDPALAARACALCDRVLEGDLTQILPELERAGERFDAIVFADVLEHLEDPIAALAAGRRIAAPGGMVLESVPNVGHLSLVRDLLLGRFDPTPSGLADDRHLRWFTRSFLAEALAEAGWSAVSVEGEPGAPPPSPEGFLALAGAWPDADRESLRTYQWIATGRVGEATAGEPPA